MAYAPTSVPSDASQTDAPRLTPVVQGVLVASVASYFLQVTVVQPSAVAAWLGYEPRHFPGRWWTAVTYAVVHGGFWHLALNLLGLSMFGPRVERAWGTRGFLGLFALSALGGWAAHVVAVPSSGLIGASAAVLGVMVAYASRWPEDEVYLFGVIPLRIRWLILGLVAINLASGVLDRGGGVAYFGHLGGLAAGWLTVRVIGGGSRSGRSRVQTAPELTDDIPRAIPRAGGRGREAPRGEAPRGEAPRGEAPHNDRDVVARSRAALASWHPPTPAPAGRDPVRREELDRVLDKIASHGMQSLTADERALLDDESRRLQKPQ